MRVLVAVPDEVLSQHVVGVLRRAGYVVEVEAGGGLAVLSRVACRRRPQLDLLILDLSRAPESVGRPLLRAIFGERWALPVIVVASGAAQVDAWTCSGAGATWTRPIAAAQIRRTVERLTRGSGKVLRQT